MVISQEQYDAELAHEEAAWKSGMEEYRKAVLASQQGRWETNNDYGKNLLVRSIKPVAERIEVFRKESLERPGRRHKAYVLMGDVEADVIAYLTAREIIDGITSGSRKFVSLALQVGCRVEEERRFTLFAEHEDGKFSRGALFNSTHRLLKKNPQGFLPHVRRSVLTHAMRKFGIGFNKWPQADALHLGRFLVETFIETTGLIEMVKLRTGKRAPEPVIHPTDELLEWATDYTNKCAALRPDLVPMISPPLPWETVVGGGYYTERFQKPLVKARSKGHLKMLSELEMPAVYAAVNTLQASQWKINAAFLTVFQDVWASGLETKGLPRRQDASLPQEPDYTKSPELWKQWKIDSGDIFKANKAAKSIRKQAIRIKLLAEQFVEYKSIWFPIQLDFRGRIYCVPKYLNPQGCDLAKALLMFSEGKPLGQRGAFWLAVHLANCYGFDKVSLEERAAWAYKNSERIQSVANDPLGDLWWTEADGGKKCFQFLAACIEWLGFIQDGGEAYVCHLPIMVDGSCNGIQHFAAMIRDEASGREVNLVPQEKPADIYGRVARIVEDRLRADVTDIGKPYAKPWLEYPVSRHMVKRPVMILPYAGTQEAVRKYLFDYLEEKKKRPVPTEQVSDAVNYLREIVWQSMHEVVQRPREVMMWLRKSASIVARSGKPFHWTTPAGFLVEQRYPDIRKFRVETRVGDVIMFPWLVEDRPKRLNSKKQSRAVSPNFVHSMDAAALMLTVNSSGLGSLAAVHDAYGTLAADMDALLKTLKGCFVAMYQQHDVLSEFAESVSSLIPEGCTLPPFPPLGSLNLEDIKSSDFFFS